MSQAYCTFSCPECDHEHEIPVIRGEYPSDDYAEIPEHCEGCGLAFEFETTVDDGPQAERRQMGITS